MDYVRIKSYAKLNLCLDITGVKDGYHMIDSLVTTVDIADVITLRKRKKDKLVTVAMHGMGSEDIPFESNNAAKAAESFIARFDCCGVDITVYKNIPMGAGLGGSSADVAGVLNGMQKLFGGSDEEIKELADSIGSDCGYMLSGGFARISGRGEKVERIDCRTKLDFVLLIPPTPVSTAECYKTYDSMFGGVSDGNNAACDEACAALVNGDKERLGKALNNALYAPAKALNPQVAEAYSRLNEFAPLGVGMTGSGSCVFALFENDQFCSYAISRYSGRFKIIQTKSRKAVNKGDKRNGRREID